MMETAEDKLRVFNRSIQEVIDSTGQLQQNLDKGRIEPEEALDRWEDRLTFMSYLIRKNKAYIDRLRVYAKKMHGSGKKDKTEARS